MSSNFTYKMAILMRTDLEMGKGKMCAQAGHCVMHLMKDVGFREQRDIYAVEKWMEEGGVKIVLKVGSSKEILDRMSAVAIDNGFMYGVIEDFGLTQIAPNTITCGYIFGRREDVEKATEGLKLL